MSGEQFHGDWDGDEPFIFGNDTEDFSMFDDLLSPLPAAGSPLFNPLIDHHLPPFRATGPAPSPATDQEGPASPTAASASRNLKSFSATTHLNPFATVGYSFKDRNFITKEEFDRAIEQVGSEIKQEYERDVREQTQELRGTVACQEKELKHEYGRLEARDKEYKAETKRANDQHEKATKGWIMDNRYILRLQQESLDAGDKVFNNNLQLTGQLQAKDQELGHVRLNAAFSLLRVAALEIERNGSKKQFAAWAPITPASNSEYFKTSTHIIMSKKEVGDQEAKVDALTTKVKDLTASFERVNLENEDNKKTIGDLTTKLRAAETERSDLRAQLVGAASTPNDASVLDVGTNDTAMADTTNDDSVLLDDTTLSIGTKKSAKRRKLEVKSANYKLNVYKFNPSAAANTEEQWILMGSELVPTRTTNRQFDMTIDTMEKSCGLDFNQKLRLIKLQDLSVKDRVVMKQVPKQDRDAWFKEVQDLAGDGKDGNVPVMADYVYYREHALVAERSLGVK